MKITIEFDEKHMSKEQALKSSLASLSDPVIIRKIKFKKNVKIVWDNEDIGVLTQQGTHLVLYKKG